MQPFQPLINLLVLMSALSIAAERVANTIKLADPELRERRAMPGAEKEREYRIGHRVLLVSIVLAASLKADLFQILAHLDAPWDTLGWVPLTGGAWGHDFTTDSLARLLYTLAGTTLTGISMGFGSKFWHDLLDNLYGARQRVAALAHRRTR